MSFPLSSGKTVNSQTFDAQLICGGTSFTNGVSFYFSRLSDVGNKLKKLEVANGLRLSWVLKTEAESKTCLKQLTNFFKKELKEPQWMSLGVVFGKDVKSVPWIRTFVELAGTGFKFEKLQCSWEAGSCDLEAAMKELNAAPPVVPPNEPPSMVLCFFAETSSEAGAVLSGLVGLISEFAWPIDALVLNFTELLQIDIPTALKRVLLEGKSSLKILFQKGKKELHLDEESANTLFDVLSSRSYCVFENIKIEFNDQVPERYFRFNSDEPQELVFMNLDISHLRQLHANGWQLEVVNRSSESLQVAITYKKDFVKQIAVFTSPEVTLDLLLEQHCLRAILPDFQLGMRTFLQLQLIKASVHLRIYVEQSEQEGIEVNVEDATIKTYDSLKHTIDALEAVIFNSGLPGLRSLVINVKNNREVNENEKLHLAKFKEDVKEKLSEVYLSIAFGDRTGVAEQQILDEELSRNRILTEKIGSAVRSGKRLQYSRPKLIVLGPSSSGKTLTLRSILNKDHDQSLVPTVIAENKWTLKISSGIQKEDEKWIVTKVDEMNNGPVSEISDVASSINHLNTNFAFSSAVAVNNSKRKQKSAKSKDLNEQTQTFKRNKLSTQKKKVSQIHKTALRKRIPKQNVLGFSKASIWDMAGSDCVLLDKVMSTGSFYLLVLSIPEYLKHPDDSSKPLKRVLREWLDYINMYSKSSRLLVIGTSCSLVFKDCIKKFSQIVDKQVGTYISLIPNQKEKLSFFPVENDKDKFSSDSFETLRKVIAENLCWLAESIPVSWLYYMDLIFHSEKDLISYAEMKEVALRNGLKVKHIPSIINKYTKMGAILSIPYKIETELHSSVIVLKPSAFIEALKSILKKTSDTGLLDSKILLEVSQEHFPSPEVCHHFLQYCEDDLLISPWPSIDNDNVIIRVPFKNVGTQPLQPPDDDQWSFCIAWETAVPRSFFTDAITLLISSTVNMGNSRAPVITDEWAVFSIRSFSFTVIKRQYEIEVKVSKAFTKYFTLIVQALEMLVADISKRVISSPAIVVESNMKIYRKKPGMFRARWTDVKRVLFDEDSEEKIPAFGMEYMLPATSFEHFETVPFLNTNDPTKVKKYDICILHDFGEDGATEENIGNKSADNPVLLVAQKLQEDHSVWVDAEGFNGLDVRFAKKIIENSTIVLLFVTRSFLRQLQNPKSTLSSQFYMAVRNGIETLVLLAMDSSVTNRESWMDTSLGFQLVGPEFEKIDDVSAMEPADITKKAKAKLELRKEILYYKENYGAVSRRQ